MFLRIHDDLVNVNDIKTISIEEELTSDKKSTRWYVIVTTTQTHGTYVLNGFDSDDKAKMLIYRIAEELEESGLLIDV